MSKSVSVAIAKIFWKQLFSLPKPQQKKMEAFLGKFTEMPTSSGINYEHIHDACQDNYRSVRLDQTYRCIVMAPKKGNVYCLLWVDHHDKAYDWARRTRVAVNPTTGVLQIFSTEVVVAEAAEATVPARPKPAGKLSFQKLQRQSGLSSPRTLEEQPHSNEPLFNLDDSRLLSIGVPESMLATVVALKTEPQLQQLAGVLPDDPFNALELIHMGCSVAEVLDDFQVKPAKKVDTDDVLTAIETEASQSQFVIVDSDDELRRMLSAPLETWRVYLHPSQRKLVERDWNGPVRVTGGAGTGKSVVAMHRAVWLARHRINNDRKVLFLTYNTNLAGDISENLRKICSAEEHQRIEVINIDAWVQRFLRSRRYTHRIVRDNELTSLWKDILDEGISLPNRKLPPGFFTEEWERVILPNRVNSRQDYLKVSRKGRGIALNRPQRATLWEHFDEMRSELQQRGWKTWQDAMLDAAELIQTGNPQLPYDAVVVDETQDMGTEALKLIRSLVPEDKNDLFVVGDGHQRIYRRRAVLGQCGIHVVGRSKKLKINYRTTEQIRRFAASVMYGLDVDDLNGDTDPSHEYVSLTQGPAPQLSGFDDSDAECEWIAERIKALTEGSEHTGSCCVLLRTRKRRDSYSDALRRHGLETVILDTHNDNQSVAGVRLASMHRVKGLEFRHIFIASMNDGIVPNTMAVKDSEDPTEIRDNDFAERALVHVAASRAIETLTITWHGKPSAYIQQP